MNKKLMAVAVAGALAAPAVALAQASSVQIYGRANLGLDSWEATGATAGSAADYKRRTRVYDSGSRLGFRGSEDLGNGLKALFVMESGVNLDTGTVNGQNNAANTSTGTLATRDSYVGLGGNWGDVRFGRQSIYWVSGRNGQTGANYINNEIGFYNGASFGRVLGPTARTNNVAQYNSPTWNGFNFTGSYAPQSEAAAGGANTNAAIWGVTLRYEGPLLGAQYDHAENQAASPIAAGANRQNRVGDKFSIGWPYQPGARIALMYIQNKLNDADAQAGFSNAKDGIKQTMWGLNWEHMMGNWQFLAMYAQLDKAKGCTATSTLAGHVGESGCAGTDAQAYTVGVRYYFSKRTQIYGSYIQHKNEWNQTTDATGAGYSSAAPAIAPGSDPKIFAVGIWHSF